MDSKQRKRINNIQNDKSPLRKSLINLTKFEQSRSKSNHREPKLRDSSASFEKKSSTNQMRNQKIIDARQYLELKKASGGLFNQKQTKQTPINSGNSSNTNKSTNNYLSSSKTKFNTNSNKSYVTEKSLNIQQVNNNKSREKYDKCIHNKSQDQYRSKEFSTSKSNLTNNYKTKYNDIYTNSNLQTEYLNNHKKTNSEISIAQKVPDRQQIVKNDSFYKDEINKKLRISSKDKMNAIFNLNKDRYNQQYVNIGCSEYNTNIDNSGYYQDNNHTFKPREDDVPYDLIQSNYCNNEKFRKIIANDNEINFNLSSNNYIKHNVNLENHFKKNFLTNSKLDNSRNNFEKNKNFNETFGRISNKSMNNLSDHNRSQIATNENFNPPTNKSIISDQITENQRLKTNIQKYLKKNEYNNTNLFQNFHSENSFYSNNQNFDFRNSNESRINTDKSNKNKIGSNVDKEIKVSYDEKFISDYKNYLKQNQETGDSYKFKMTNTHSSGNASNPIDDYKNIKFENVEETHFINLYILQSSKNMLKVQEQIYDDKNLFKTVTQLDEEIDL